MAWRGLKTTGLVSRVRNVVTPALGWTGWGGGQGSTEFLMGEGYGFGMMRGACQRCKPSKTGTKKIKNNKFST